LYQSIKKRTFARGTALLGLTLASAAVLATPAYASSLTINAIFAPSITGATNAAQVEAVIQQAVSFYESIITTPITVNINYGEMTTGLGSSSTFFGVITYSQYLATLTSHSSGDATDTAALASLPAGPDNPVNGGTQVDVTTANLRALGFSATPSGGQPDSTVLVNTSITNYAGSTFNPNFYDLLAVIEHETDEALGLGSDIGNPTTDIRGEDLFRYSANGARSYTTNSSAAPYFSVNGGVTDLIGFNQTGGGADYGDWASSTTAHVQDAFGTPGATPVFGVEQTALDAIGYNFASVAATPEPSTFWLLSLGAAGVLGFARFRQTRRS
jgi:hypothetical protein